MSVPPAFFHGTAVELKAGDLVLPSLRVGGATNWSASESQYAYVAQGSCVQAGYFALCASTMQARRARSCDPHVYQVRPLHSVSVARDEYHDSQSPYFRSTSGFVVLSEVEISTWRGEMRGNYHYRHLLEREEGRRADALAVHADRQRRDPQYGSLGRLSNRTVSIHSSLLESEVTVRIPQCFRTAESALDYVAQLIEAPDGWHTAEEWEQVAPCRGLAFGFHVNDAYFHWQEGEATPVSFVRQPRGWQLLDSYSLLSDRRPAFDTTVETAERQPPIIDAGVLAASPPCVAFSNGPRRTRDGSLS